MVTAGDGDGWVILADGSRRWGLYGASGLLLYSVDESGTGHVLLQHRAPWTHQGGTWGLPGGARNSGESSVSAAIREFVEEVDGDLGTLSLLGIHRQDHQVWVFDTVLASVPERRPFTPGNPESESIRWIPVPDVPSMPLLPAFGKVWPEVAAALSEQLLLIVDTTVVPQSITPGALCHRLTELAQVGVTDDMLPPDVPLTPLHRRFPSVLLLVDAHSRAALPAPVHGVDVVQVSDGSAAAIAQLVSERLPQTRIVVATDHPDTRAQAAALGVHTAPVSWAYELAQREESSPVERGSSVT
ncbi:hypothetical protein JCM3263A_16330 [Thermobifida fusca]|jgi:8-oxo-dGTP diphosphatase|uniref:Nudix hydrolase domain-containing protein n=2 Tax=Thermobifida fusca TaxID=2021 RepID=A0A9P2WSH7_THEFU|nr:MULTISPECIES: NUDIX domain-containing protein [Thermobifida]AAZ54135.1 hypothetical protein Tfu_0097 [Thermobifida fusca YX]EOR72738.1 hypothetical protein TM51_00806 [Thermobifida fusca TM51]MBO2530958.1 NUDIX domain-containing protein [Thermobifida sp.]MDD6793337.1 NUDIX domain-containing protein [Thermobifida fusca]PPS91539.1 hypothetical protein BH05_14605 [Thermobifida fusca]